MQSYVATEYPVLTAAQAGPESLLDELKAGGNPDELHILYGRVLHWAVVVGKQQEAELLLAAGADVNAHGKHGRTPLHYACLRANVNAVRVLVDAGADLDAPCHPEEGVGGEPPADGPRPLDVAHEKGCTEAVSLLEGTRSSKEERRARWESTSHQPFELHFLRKKRKANRGSLEADADAARASSALLTDAADESAHEPRSRGCCVS